MPQSFMVLSPLQVSTAWSTGEKATPHTPRSPNSPPYLWLRFTTKTFRVNILINVGTMEYLLSTGPKIAAIGVDIPPRGVVRKHPQSKNWLAWFSAQRPDLHPHLLATRE